MSTKYMPNDNNSLDFSYHIDAILAHYRDPLIPKEINELSDINFRNNNILLNSAFERKKYGFKDMVLAFKNKNILNKLLNEEFEQIKKENKPNHVADNYENLFEFAVFNSENLGFTYEFSDGTGILLADKKNTFPTYSTIHNEKSANIPLFLTATGNTMRRNDEINIRTKSIDAQVALGVAIRHIRPKDIGYMKKSFATIARSHEQAEIALGKHYRKTADRLELELAAEDLSRSCLAITGFDMDTYYIFHIIRTGKEPTNVSRNITKTISIPEYERHNP